MGAAQRVSTTRLFVVAIMAAATLSLAALRLTGFYSASALVDGWFPPLTDFVNIWLAATLAVAGHADVLGDPVSFNEARVAVFGGSRGHVWSYPPHALALFAPLGFLPFPAAAILWVSGSVAVFVATLRRALHLRWRVVALCGLSTGAVFTLAMGQVSAFALALLAGGLHQLERRPVLAGVLFGLLTVKPQLGLLVPVVLIARRAWSAMAAAVITAGALAIASVALIGGETWVHLATHGMQTSAAALYNSEFALTNSVSWASSLRLLQAPSMVVWTVQASAMALAAIAVAWAARQSDANLPDVLLSMTVLALPYCLQHDTLLLAPVAARMILDPSASPGRVGVALLTLCAGLAVALLASASDLPLSALLVTAFSALVLDDAIRSRFSRAPDLPTDLRRPSVSTA